MKKTYYIALLALFAPSFAYALTMGTIQPNISSTNLKVATSTNNIANTNLRTVEPLSPTTIIPSPNTSDNISDTSTSSTTIAPLDNLKIIPQVEQQPTQTEPDHSTGSDVESDSVNNDVGRVEVGDESSPSDNSKSNSSSVNSIENTRLQEKPTVPVVAVLPNITIVTPNGGEKIELDGTKTQNILYEFGGNFDIFKNGKYKIHPEIWRNDAKLGDLFNTDFSLNLNKPNSNIGFQPGVYLVKTRQYNLEKHIAEVGDGYEIKLTIFNGSDEVVSDMSDGPFSYTEANNPAYDSSRPSTVSVVEPNGGESYQIGKNVDGSVVFSVQNFDPYQGGQYTFQAELWKGGQKLGILAHYLPFPLNIYKNPTVLSYRTDAYQTTNPISEKSIRPGSDYMVKVVAYNNGEEIAEDSSDAAFTYTGEAMKPGPLQTINAPDDIKPYLAELVHKDANIKTVDVNDTKVDITYRAPAKLFGFIPLHYDLQVSQNIANKNVSVKKPWWLFFTSNNANDITKSIEDAKNKLDDLTDNLNSNSEMEMLKLQSLMQNRQQAIQLASNMLEAIASSTEAIVQNIQ